MGRTKARASIGRSHWRVLHRGSEFENPAWVHECLVGDPEKRFVRSRYRLVHEMPMIVNDNPQPVPSPIGEPPP